MAITMKLQIVSDLHLEFEGWLPHNSGSDVLVVAGDTMVLSDLELCWQGIASTKTASRAKQYIEFVEHCSKNWPHTVIVLGNHEYYGGVWPQTSQTMRTLCGLYHNVHLLDCGAKEICGVVFLGTTLWTDVNRNDPITHQVIAKQLNDYRVITKHCNNQVVPLTSKDTMLAHHKAVEWLVNTLGSITRPCVVVTHHAPTHQSISSRYRGEHHLNGAYASNLGDLVLDHQPSMWIHGHMHNSSDYYINNTRVVCNPKGYCNENPNFNPNQIYAI